MVHSHSDSFSLMVGPSKIKNLLDTIFGKLQFFISEFKTKEECHEVLEFLNTSNIAQLINDERY